MDLIDDRAILDEEEDEGSFDEDTGEVKRKLNGANGHFEDSSEEEDDDDDEEAAAEVPLVPALFVQSWTLILFPLGSGGFHRGRR